MRLTKKEKAEIAADQEYIKKARSIFDSLKYLGSGGATMKQVIEDFDRLGVARTGRVFAAILCEAMDNGFEIRDEPAKDQAPTQPLFDLEINTTSANQFHNKEA